MNVNRKAKAPQKALLYRIAITAVIIVAAALFLHFGPNHTDVTLKDANAKETLQGFTLQGVAGDEFYHQNFILENGSISNRFALRNAPTRWWWSFNADASISFAVAAHEQDAVNEKAKTKATPNLTTTGLYSECNDLDAMITVRSGDKSVRFHSGITYHSSQPIEVGTYFVQNAFGQRTMMDYSPYQRTEDGPGAPNPPAVKAVQLADTAYVVFGGTKSTAAALYRVEKMLTDKEVKALPRDGFVGDSAVLRTSTPYGEVREMHRFPSETFIIDLWKINDLLCVVLCENETVTLYLMDENANIVDTYPTNMDLPLSEGAQLPYVQLSPQQSEDEICFALGKADAQIVAYYGLRLKDNKIIAACNTQVLPKNQIHEIDATKLESSLFGISLRADNEALLVANIISELLPTENTDHMIYFENGVQLAVYEANAQNATVVNRLQCNQGQDHNAMRTKYTGGGINTSSTRSFFCTGFNGDNQYLMNPSMEYYANY